MKREIVTRTDVAFLVRAFYVEIRSDRMLGLIFEQMIKFEHWEHHFDVLTNFWESNLLKARSYEGRPIGIHLWVDMQTGRRMTQLHFDRWLEPWHDTVDKHFTGDVAETAKSRAVTLAKSFFSKIQNVRETINSPN